MYIIIVECKEVKSKDGEIITESGKKALVTNEPEGWVPATSSNIDDSDRIPLRAKLFDTRELADKFAKSWKGHPWYCKPKKYEIIRVEIVYKQVPDYYAKTT